jgi:hypothetical protein
MLEEGEKEEAELKLKMTSENFDTESMNAKR